MTEIPRNSGKIRQNLRRKIIDLLNNPHSFEKLRKNQRKITKERENQQNSENSIGYLCRSRKMLNNEPTLAIVGVDTAEI